MHFVPYDVLHAVLFVLEESVREEDSLRIGAVQKHNVVEARTVEQKPLVQPLLAECEVLSFVSLFKK
jgi:hypothetical protein